MREILFRGKIKRPGEMPSKWVEGGYCRKSETTYCFAEDYERNPVAVHHYIARDEMTDWGLPNEVRLYEVDPSTVSQYTGLKDKNGQRIFEGDILEARLDDDYPENITRVVVGWEFNGWAFIQHEHGLVLTDRADDTDSGIWTVCGNIWDNPELIGGGEND